jgi:hypothetical protein
MTASIKGVRWAYLGMGIGGAASILANVAHACLPEHPPAGSVIAAAFWPVALFVTIEILAKNAWPSTARWTLLRWGGTLPVAAVTAVVSYRHMSGLLAAWGEDPLTATIGPIAVDGLLIMSTGAIVAAGAQLARPVAVVEPVPEVAPAPVVEPLPVVEELKVAPAPALPARAKPGKPAVIPDGDLAQVVRETVTSHAVGWGTVKAAIEAGGWSVGNTGRVKTAIAQRKADLPDEPRRGLSAVGG